MERTRRRYSDNDRAEALATLDANGGNLLATSKVTGVPIATLSGWRDGAVSDDVSDIRNEKKAELHERLDAIAHRCLDLLPDKLDALNGVQLATTVAIAIDKAQLLKGKPTEITQQTLSDEDKLSRLRELLGRGEDRASLPAPDAGGAGGSRPAPSVH